MNHRTTAERVLAGVGGEQNVASLAHCATRLRFKVKDATAVDKSSLEATPGVVAVVEAGGQLQVVIGNEVPRVFAEIGAIATLGDAADGNAPKGSLLARTIDMISGIFLPLLWPMAGAGMLKALLALVVKVGWLSAASNESLVLNAAGDALFYFLPVLLAATAAKRFGANQYVSMAIAGSLLYPAIVQLHDKGEAVHFLGLPMVLISYASSVLPILLAVWVQSQVERFFGRVLHSSVRSFLTPMLTLAVVVPVTLLSIGPLADYAGKGVSSGVTWVFGLSPFVGGALLGGFWQVLVMFGLHWGVVPVMINDLSTQGHSVLSGPLVPAVLAQVGAGAAVFLRTRNRGLKGLAGTGAVSGFLAGVTEPLVYGVTLRLKKPFIYACVAAAVGGGIACSGGSAANTFALASALTLPAYLSVGNFTLQLIGCAVALGLGFALTMVLGFKDIPEEASEAEETPTTAGSGPVEVTAPVAGAVLPLDQVPDPMFSAGLLGDGAAITPSSGEVHAPVEGTLVSAMPHAYGIRTHDGVEVLVHVGIDTVQLHGEHFTQAVQQGAEVEQGQLLGEFDIDAILAAGYDPVTMVVVTAAPDELGPVTPTDSTELRSGEALLTLA
ncbi:beta-glucoside-specific PTS transporter subunit IIABC [Streptacidiphilus jiangxiensis]|uniref:PTS system, beta-glucosides-specific IIC component n=1 Tax=Streptacidiphilus jiangxiensis TaxID=235985 RepID=A0A1H7X0F9_STRJI|nr:beta-glucoside-specific PTS transporter subunit IIABC [Streptacidiphilus jiangxiensis]SEM26609.1 PTS system, beta-glucosides-specific IIC component [Streptacidiphilus jiangxiensis]